MLHVQLWHQQHACDATWLPPISTTTSCCHALPLPLTRCCVLMQSCLPRRAHAAPPIPAAFSCSARRISRFGPALQSWFALAVHAWASDLSLHTVTAKYQAARSRAAGNVLPGAGRTAAEVTGMLCNTSCFQEKLNMARSARPPVHNSTPALGAWQRTRYPRVCC